MSLIDLTDVKTDNDAVENGKYEVVCTAAEERYTKAGTGQYINAAFKIIGSDFDGRQIYTMFNIKNQNEQAVTIGHRQLKSFMEAAGVVGFDLKSAKDLEGLKCQVTTKIKTDEWGTKATISYYKKSEVSSAAAVPTIDEDSIPF